MEHASHHPLLPALSEFLARQIGLHFPQERWPDLMRGLQEVARDFQSKDISACIAQLLSSSLSRSQIETLARHLTIGETYFFREPQVFEALQEHILPALIHARRQSSRHLRLWSAGCSTGEEAYSLAIMAQRLIPDFAQWNITILGTDINPQALEKAAAGIYGEWSFRNAPSWLRERYFRNIGKGQYEVIPAVRDMVTFSYLNLAEDVYPSLANNTNAMDLIFCRNVLMYFEPELAASVVQKHYQALVENGWLVVSPSEISQGSFERFAPAHFSGAILHQKTDGAQKKESIAPLPSPALPTLAAQKSIRKTSAAHPPPSEAAIPLSDPGYQQALTLYRQGLYQEAAAATARLLESRHDKVPAMTLMARIHANQGDLETALSWCERAIAADRLKPVGHYLLGAILKELGRGPEAALAYKRTLYLDPDFVLAQFALGNLFRDQHKPREAAKHFGNALLILARHPADDVLPEADGMTTGRLMEIIRSSMHKEAKAA